MATILLAEQSSAYQMNLHQRLKAKGFEVTSVIDAQLCSAVKQHPFDLIIQVSGSPEEKRDIDYEEIRKFSDVPWVMIDTEGITYVTEEETKKSPYKIEDISKDDKLLADMINEYLRDAYRKFHNMRLNRFKCLKISTGSLKNIQMNHVTIDLTVTEGMILKLLMSHRTCIFTKAILYESIWRQPYVGDDNVVKIHISNLRNKLKKADPNGVYIETVRGLGYRLCKE